jgi:hypothetical protein
MTEPESESELITGPPAAQLVVPIKMRTGTVPCRYDIKKPTKTMRRYWRSSLSFEVNQSQGQNRKMPLFALTVGRDNLHLVRRRFPDYFGVFGPN